ncbi:U6 snRNA phosphodiesterase 1 [Sitodiplosis mosellana]|uniref:U6 snRNA phosphodiesterase 1 n=1 Tax=Sitodiplosis mosellana TaxID=263140 RepID=UPI002444DABB|nr:U6 snRNA phosphodiesterase 1 [Sitodiplosis mosellana]
MSLNLVNYSDSSSDEEIEVQKNPPLPKSKLPNPFQKTNEVNKQEDDGSAKHNGRIRLFPHERGNWATYIYIHYPKTDFIVRLQNELLDQIKSTSTLETIEFHPNEELHLSLTRTVVLQHHWIDEFVRSVEQKLRNTNRFWINLSSIQIYCNDNQTRTFISLSFAEKNTNSTQNLQNIVNQLDSCLKEFKLPSFYKEASFHVSLLWCLGDRRNELHALLPQFCKLLEHLSSIDDSNLTIDVEKLFCKIGNKLYSFHL